MMPFAATDSSDPWIVLVVLLGGLYVLAVLPRRLARARRKYIANNGASGAEEKKLAGSMEELLKEFKKASREMNMTVEAKAALLQRLIREADSRIKNLEMLAQQPNIAREAAAQRDIDSKSERSAPPPRHEQVYRLADDGKDILEISRQTGIQRGEVELILGLRGNIEE